MSDKTKSAEELAIERTLSDLGYRTPLMAYQYDAGLVVDGAVGPQTRAALIADQALRKLEPDSVRSCGLIVRMEGTRGVPYWPGGNSGVTLDRGWDLANGRPEQTRELYGGLWSEDVYEELTTAFGLRAQYAERWVKSHDVSKWPIPADVSARALPYGGRKYWEAALQVCPSLAIAPACVQTALWSVTYNAWTHAVRAARLEIEDRQWLSVAEIVRNAGGTGHSGRRAVEAEMIERAVV